MAGAKMSKSLKEANLNALEKLKTAGVIII